jgi:glucose/arabinose dehydrogenase
MSTALRFVMRVASALGLVLALAAPAAATVTLTPIATLSAPVAITHARDERLFIVEQQGRIRIYDTQTNTLLATPFLDIVAKVASGGERGLLSVAFHPDYASNGFFFVNYTNLSGNTVIERYQVGANRNVANPASGVTLLVIAQPFENHNGGQLQIDPSDGYLYIGMGDGGSANDPNCNAQRKDALLGKMLRLDVRQNLNQAPYYGIPSSNPFRAATDPNNEIPDEVWAFGLRNPWRFSFDRLTFDLYIADVGQDQWEEIDFHRASDPGGKNFGWKLMEGAHCYSNSNCPAGTPVCPSGLTLPVYEYAHGATECSVTGGYVYRGTQASGDLAGRYVFGDYCSGRIRALTQTSPGVFTAQELLTAGGGLTTFGESSSGELYAAIGNGIYRFGSTLPPVTPPAVPAIPARQLALLALGLAALSLLALGRGRLASRR